jgi:uncharacterized protein
MLTDAEIDQLVARIVELLKPQKVILFGSYAKGTATIRSDVDFFVIHDTHLPPENRLDNVRPLLSNFLFPVDVHIYTPEEAEEYGRDQFSFVHSVVVTGRTVYEKKRADALKNV